MHSILSITAILALAAVVLASEPVKVDSKSCSIKAAAGEFTYDKFSDHGPDHWGSIKEEFRTCGTGGIQSPINFTPDVKFSRMADGPKPMLKISDFTFGATSENWALTCAEEKKCGYTMFGGKTYYYVNTHFHSPSEHYLNGKQYPLESHMVHISEDGEIAVIATMYDYPGDSDYPSQVMAAGHKDYGVNNFFTTCMGGVMHEDSKITVHPMDIIDESKGFCVYTGSLTTPPCTEGVTFIMSMNVQTVSKRQVHDYRLSCGSPYDGNNRPVQPLNGREITCYL